MCFCAQRGEVLDEYKERMRRSRIWRSSTTICFYYPLPMYFWFSKTEQGRARPRAEEEMPG